jgi:protein gp37
MEITQIKTQEPAVRKFNRTNDNIEWAYWTWNPVTGCKFGCEYCYARDIANRFYKEKFEPTFHPERLSAPQDTPIPKEDNLGEHNVFVCSMADLFGDWVPDEWINAVLDSIKNAPAWWNFLFLTKNPRRYLKLKFPPNCWIGATATNQSQMNLALEVFAQLKLSGVKNSLFISCEPFMGKIDIQPEILKNIDWLIIGGRSKTSKMPEGQPDWQWVEELHCNAVKSGLSGHIYWKPNLLIRPKGYPKKSVQK